MEAKDAVQEIHRQQKEFTMRAFIISALVAVLLWGCANSKFHRAEVV